MLIGLRLTYFTSQFLVDKHSDGKQETRFPTAEDQVARSPARALDQLWQQTQKYRGHLLEFTESWCTSTSDAQVLKTVSHVYVLEFAKKP